MMNGVLHVLHNTSDSRLIHLHAEKMLAIHEGMGTWISSFHEETLTPAEYYASLKQVIGG
jgi:hypothetical protein